jgi:uncharacterized membrane protein YjgN (DUF898 family)
MNATKTVQILGKDYPQDNIKYSYTGSKMRYKRFLKYPIILFGVEIVANIAFGIYISNQFDNSLKYSLDNLNDISNNARTWETFSAFLLISLIIAFIILLIPRIKCLFLKIDGIKKDIVLYKSIHKDEVALIANEINTKIKENNFSSFPY